MLQQCFSTLERLRYAEAQAQAQAQVDTKLNSINNLERNSSRTLLTSKSISKLRENIKLFTSNQNVPTKPLPSGSSCIVENITLEHALWFSNLPEKVKRAYFSTEEERLFGIKSKGSVSDERSKTIYKAGEIFNRSLPSLQSPSSGSSSPTCSTIDSLFSKDVETMNADLTSTFNWVDTNLDLSLHDYQKTVVDSRKSIIAVPRTSSVYSFRRSIRSVRNLNLDVNSAQSAYPEVSQPTQIVKTLAKDMIDGGSSGWAPVPMLPDLGITKTTRIQTTRSGRASIVSLDHRKASRVSRRYTRLLDIETSASPKQIEEQGKGLAPEPSMLLTPPEGPESTPNTEVAHYLNPEARLKLRAYLGSASKFDEVIEFGFPSLNDERNESSDDRRQRSITDVKRDSARDFDTIPTCVASTSTTDDSTSTPESSSTSSEFFSIPYTSLSDIKPTTTQNRKPDYHAQLRKLDRDTLGLMNRREMTIRMTLTRPDLRANETSLYPQSERSETSYEGYKDPLQLQPLSLNERLIPITSFGQKTFSLKRLWNRK